MTPQPIAEDDTRQATPVFDVMLNGGDSRYAAPQTSDSGYGADTNKKDHWPWQKAEEASMHLCRLRDGFGMVTDPLTTDAHIASLAIEYGYAVYSTDNDFKRFTGIRHINPLTV